MNQVLSVVQCYRVKESDDDQESANAEWKRLQSELRLTFF